MSVMFAAARTKTASPVARILSRPEIGRAANDDIAAQTNDLILNAALRHFAMHGIQAAKVASDNASEAFFAGNREEYDWWLAICHTLDRRMASGVMQDISA